MSPTLTLTAEQYILYILNRLQPERSDLRMVNKIAFLVEFAYLYFKEKELSKAKYAAIDHGPVIDDYKLILSGMEKKGLIKLDGYKIRLVDSAPMDVSKELDDFASPLIAKYSQMNANELRALTHSMDSYLITTRNEKVMGKKIDKDLAALETIFEPEEATPSPEVDLPNVDFNKLVSYELGH
jgi:uncharacterized phage-associated protein